MSPARRLRGERRCSVRGALTQLDADWFALRGRRGERRVSRRMLQEGETVAGDAGAVGVTNQASLSGLQAPRKLSSDNYFLVYYIPMIRVSALGYLTMIR